MNDIHDPLKQRMDYQAKKRPPPPWKSGKKLPPVVNAPDTGDYGSEDLPKHPPAHAEGVHGQGKDTH